MKDDVIYRQAAIDVISAVFPVDPMKSVYAQGIACGAALAKTYVEQLPSAEPTISKMEKVRDTISRQAAKDIIKNHKSDFSTEKDYRTARASVNEVPSAQSDLDSAYQEGYTAAEAKYRAIIDDMKAIHTERKTGHWKLLNNGDAICSECGRRQKGVWDFDNWDNFCRHCGADMRGEQHE